MEKDNRLVVAFGDPKDLQKTTKSEITVELKIKKEGLASQMSEPFRIQLKAKAKPGCSSDALNIFKKLFNPEKRFQPIPQIVYFSIKEQFIRFNYTEQGNSVAVEVTPGPQFVTVSESLQQTFKKFGFEDVAKDGFSLKLNLSSPLSWLDKAVSFAECEDEYFFPHVLQQSRLAMSFDKSSSHLSVIDSLVSLAFADRRMFNFSSLEALDAEIEVDLDRCEFTKKSVKSNYLFDTIETLFRDAVSQFNAYSEKQLKQIAKLKGLLKDKVEPEFEIVLTLKDLGQVSINLKGDGLYEFLEFICLHPSATEHTDHLSSFYELWLSRVGSSKSS